MTTSPAESGSFGRSATVWSPLEKPYVPATVPLQRPNAQNDAAVTEARETGWSKCTTIGVEIAALRVWAAGSTDTTESCPADALAPAASATNAAGNR